MLFDDLLGGSGTISDPPQGAAEPAAQRPSLRSVLKPVALQPVGGVTVNWLAHQFRKSRPAVIAALKACEPISQTKNDGPLYDLADAAAYLVVSKRDKKTFLKTLTSKDLPDELREAFWNAKIKEMKARTMAGDLWPTPAVLEVLGETFSSIKKTTMLWRDTIDESCGLTIKQRELLLLLIDRLMSEVQESLVKQAATGTRESFLEEIDVTDG